MRIQLTAEHAEFVEKKGSQGAMAPSYLYY